MPRYFRIDRWLGQVGSETQTVASGEAMRISSKACRQAPVPPGGLPKPGKIDVQLPNNHFQYALTWFGLALSLAGVYVVWLFGRLRRS